LRILQRSPTDGNEREAGMSDVIMMEAVEIVDLLSTGQLSPHDLLDALEARIALVDPKINALPTHCFERARAHADRLLQLPLSERGPLAGLPLPIKDLTDVAGVRSTQGSTIFAHHIPQQSDLLVEHLEAQGGIVYAKSNTPEFGAGANTFNEVFGATLNPRDQRLSVAGSSGGAAAALATGMAWVAHGSDFGGSLRNPASFCNIVGFRPTPGRVARTPGAKIDNLLNVEGPMARTVSDCALLFDAMCGADSRDRVSREGPGAGAWLAAARSNWRPLRVAYSADLGITPVDPEVAALTKKAALRLAEIGVIVEEAHPDFSEAHECFGTLRAYTFAASKAGLLATHREQLKPELVWNIEKGLALSSAELIRAEQQRARMCRSVDDFFMRYDLLLCPATIVPPYPVVDRFVDSCNGVKFSNYIEWLAIAYAISIVACPAMSLPCGFTSKGLPVGLQIVGRSGDDGRVFAGGRLLEELLQMNTGVPILPFG
jgi:amidase